MESFDMFLNGNFVALDFFQRTYGVHTGGDNWAIPTRWQSALFQSGQCGAFVGVFLAGPVTNRFGYRWTTIMALLVMNATIFISFFVSTSVPLLSSSTDKNSHRPIRSPCLSLDKLSRVFPGDSSSRTPPHMPVRSFLSPFEVLARLLCR